MNDNRWAQGKLEFLKFFEYVFPFGQSGSFWRVEFLPVTLVQVPTTRVVKTFCSQQSLKVGDHLFFWIRFTIWKDWLLLESWAPLFKCQLLGRLNNFAYTAIHKPRISFFCFALDFPPKSYFTNKWPKVWPFVCTINNIGITETLPASILIKGWG